MNRDIEQELVSQLKWRKLSEIPNCPAGSFDDLVRRVDTGELFVAVDYTAANQLAHSLFGTWNSLIAGLINWVPFLVPFACVPAAYFLESWFPLLGIPLALFSIVFSNPINPARRFAGFTGVVAALATLWLFSQIQLVEAVLAASYAVPFWAIRYLYFRNSRKLTKSALRSEPLLLYLLAHGHALIRNTRSGESFRFRPDSRGLRRTLPGGPLRNDHSVDDEAELVSPGLSPEQAREASQKASAQGSPASMPSDESQPAESSPSSEVTLLAAQRLVNNYGAVLEHSRTVTRSEAELPATKEQIKDALVALARHSKASGAATETLEPLRVGYASLADFVSERDADAANTFDSLASAGAADLDDTTFRELVAKIAESGPGALDVTRQSTEEFARLIVEFDDRVRD